MESVQPLMRLRGQACKGLLYLGPRSESVYDMINFLSILIVVVFGFFSYI
jgi:hypothetical protein